MSAFELSENFALPRDLFGVQSLRELISFSVVSLPLPSEHLNPPLLRLLLDFSL